MLRVQLPFWVVVTVSHEPELHVGVKTLRLRVPVVSQVLENPPQLPQPP